MLKMNNYLTLLVVLLAIKSSFQQIKIGANLDGIKDWSRTHAFVDLVKQSRVFGSADQPWVSGPNNPPLDKNGWPTTDFGVILWIDPVTNMTGTYKMSFQCETTPKIALVASIGQIKNILYDSVGKIVTADIIIPPTNTQTMVSFKDTISGVRNLKVIRPGYDPLNPPVFTTTFLNHFKQFDTLRFMDWGSTNGNPVSTWDERTPHHYPTMSTEKGVAWEYQISLANELSKNIWICVPHKANDFYVQKLAELIKANLNPNSVIYVEYSNEVWNWGFSQTNWVYQTASAEVNSTSTSNLNYDKVNNPGYWLWRYNARRAKEIIEIFKQVFGSENNRIKGVFAAQSAYPDGMLKVGLQYINDVYGSPNKYFSYIAGAPYFGLEGKDVANNLTKDDILNYLDHTVEVYRTDVALLKNRYFGAFYGIPMIAYEGGPDTFGPNNIESKRLASYDPRMETICRKYLDIWFSYGFGLFNWFVAGATDWTTRYGTWGLTEVMSNQDTPKSRAISNYIAKTGQEQVVTVGTLLPATLDGRQAVGTNYFNWQNVDKPTVYKNGVLDYLVRSTKNGKYSLVLNVSTNTATTIKIEVNNSLLTTIDVANTNNVFVPQTSIPLNVITGFNGIKLTCVNGNFKVNELVLTETI